MKPRHAALALALAAALAGGCNSGADRSAVGGQRGGYRVTGKVISAQGMPVPQARLKLSMMIPTALGPRLISAWGLADGKGEYQITVNVPFEAVRTATRITVAAGAPGVGQGSVLLAPPEKQQDAYKAPPVVLRPPGARAPAPAAGPEEPAPEPGPAPSEPSPLPWKN